MSCWLMAKHHGITIVDMSLDDIPDVKQSVLVVDDVEVLSLSVRTDDELRARVRVGTVTN